MKLAFELEVVATSKLPKFSDKVILPPSVLSSIVDSYSESSLPHPLIFGMGLEMLEGCCYVGVKEFSGEEGFVVVPEGVLAKLQKLLVETGSRVSVGLVDDIPKGKELCLRPVQFYTQVRDWKYYLESKLTYLYTTLTKGDILKIQEGENVFDLRIESVGDGIQTVSIIDTDMLLDVVPLNDIMASQQLEFNKLSYYDDEDKIEEMRMNSVIDVANVEPFRLATFQPKIYKLELLREKMTESLVISVKDTSRQDPESLFNMDLIVGLDKLTNLENFRWTTMDDDFNAQFALDQTEDRVFEKRVIISLQENDNLLALNRTADKKTYIYIVPFAWEAKANASISVRSWGLQNEYDGFQKKTSQDELEGLKTCSNCRNRIREDKFVLHEAFCHRNNVKCSCGLVFLKQVPSDHWHCDKCDDQLRYGSSALLKYKHDKLYHEKEYKCDRCSYDGQFHTYMDMVANHKSFDCPGKLHECRFCRLIIPQGESTYEDRFLNLSNHENSCGNKTTECYKCNKVLRSKDLSNHLHMHDLDKLEMNRLITQNFKKCLNENCVVLIEDNKTENALDLCVFCYGPLFSTQFDPSGIKLQSLLERKYMLQLSKGCGNSWCRNANCKTANSDAFGSKSPKELLVYINTTLFPEIKSPALPMNSKTNPNHDNNGNSKTSQPSNKLWLCVNESIQHKSDIFSQLVSEHEFSPEIIYRALNVTPEASIDLVRFWLYENGIKQT